MPAARPSASPPRFSSVGIVILTVAVFTAVVAFVTILLRSGLREQVLLREGEKFSAVASMQLAVEAATLKDLGLTDAPGELLTAVLKTSKLRGVLAIRVFDATAHFTDAIPWAWSEAPPPAEDWQRLVAGHAIARLHPDRSLSQLTGLSAEPAVGETTFPLLEAWVPLRRSEAEPLAGAAQFWSDGRDIAAEFSSLDRHLGVQAGLAWLAGSIVIVAALGWAFRRLAAANQALATQGEDLQRANRELVLAAKTSALGAVTAHLFHELKNPVAGLEVFVASQSEPNRGERGLELAAASELTRRLRTMINDVVAVLRDEQSGGHFTLTGAEIAEIALGKARAVADARGVKLTSEIAATSALTGRRANLVCLVVQNLLQNAVEASPPGATVKLIGNSLTDGGMEFFVEDRGTGLPESIRAQLFQPCVSTKQGGSGLGLALSRQLAQQAGGRLELLRSTAEGTCFRLSLSPDA